MGGCGTNRVTLSPFCFMNNKEGHNKLQPMMVIRQAKILLAGRILMVHLIFFVSCSVFLTLLDGETAWFKIQGFGWINVIELAVLFYATVRWHNHYYLLRPDKILTSRGVFLRRQRFFAVKNIESISVHQGVIGRLFNFGTLYLYAPTLNHRIKMFGINAPCGKERIIEQLLPSALLDGKKSRNLFIVPKEDR